MPTRKFCSWHFVVSAALTFGCEGLIGGTGMKPDAGIASGVDAGFDAGADAGPTDAGVDGGLDGSTVDAGGPSFSTNRAEFFGAPRCGSGLVLCDDFENRPIGGLPDPTLWSLNATANVTIAIDATHAARGTHSVRFTTPNVPSEAYIRETMSFGATGNAFYGRLFYYQAAPGPQNFAHWNVIEATGPQTVDGVNMTSFYRYGGVSLGGIFNNYLFQYEHRPREPNFEEIGWSETNGHRPIGDWVCLEWFFDGDATEGRLWLDGVELLGLHTTSPFHATTPQPHDVPYRMPVFTGLNLGWAHYQFPEAGYEVWIDEVDGRYPTHRLQSLTFAANASASTGSPPDDRRTFDRPPVDA